MTSTRSRRFHRLSDSELESAGTGFQDCRCHGDALIQAARPWGEAVITGISSKKQYDGLCNRLKSGLFYGFHRKTNSGLKPRPEGRGFDPSHWQGDANPLPMMLERQRLQGCR
jgi:hypothetical protein